MSDHAVSRCNKTVLNISSSWSAFLKLKFVKQRANRVSIANYAWAEGKVYALGVQFSTSEINESSVNFCEKIEKMRKILSSWSANLLS